MDMHVPKPPPAPRTVAAKTQDVAKPAPGAPKASLGGTPSGSPAAEPVPAATLKAAGFGETLAASAVPALVPLAINAVSDAHAKSKEREAYRQYLIGRLKSGSVLIPLKKQLGSYAEGLLEDTAEQLNRAVREPIVQPPPFSSIPPIRNPL